MTWLLAALRLAGIWRSISASAAALWARVWAWVNRNPSQALIVVLCLALALCVHVVRVERRAVARMATNNAALRKDITALMGTIKDQGATIARQNIATMALGKASAAAQAQGAKADQAALDRSKHRTDLSNQIANAPPAAGTCRTPDAVMAAKGDL